MTSAVKCCVLWNRKHNISHRCKYDSLDSTICLGDCRDYTWRTAAVGCHGADHYDLIWWLSGWQSRSLWLTGYAGDDRRQIRRALPVFLTCCVYRPWRLTVFTRSACTGTLWTRPVNLGSVYRPSPPNFVIPPYSFYRLITDSIPAGHTPVFRQRRERF